MRVYKTPLISQQRNLSLTGPKHALIGTPDFCAERISARVGDTGHPKKQRWNLCEVTAAFFCAGQINWVPPANLHDAPLQEFQIQLFQAFGYYGTGCRNASRHCEECGG